MAAADGLAMLHWWETARRWLTRGGIYVVACALVVLAAYCAGRHDAPADHPLPPALAHRVEFHALQSAVDTAALHRLARTADSLSTAQRGDSVRAAQLARSAARTQHRADSLARVADAAKSAQDSAAAWHAAYDARTTEADTLRQALVVTRSALADANARADATAAANTINDARATRADSITAAVVAYARTADPPCRVLHVLGCPSRMTSAVTGTALGATAVALLVHFLH